LPDAVSQLVALIAP